MAQLLLGSLVLVVGTNSPTRFTIFCKLGYILAGLIVKIAHGGLLPSE